jgi:hypothetical protein
MSDANGVLADGDLSANGSVEDDEPTPAVDASTQSKKTKKKAKSVFALHCHFITLLLL